MPDDSQVVITITGDPKQFKDALNEVSGATDKLSSHFVVTLGDMINIAKTLTDALMKPLDAYRDQELALNTLNQAMVNAGVYTADLADSYEKQSDKLQSLTTFSKEQIIQAQATLQANIGAREVTDGLTTAVLNLAAAKRIDLASAADMVGKTINSETNLLQRQGIVFDNNTVGGARLTAVMNALNDKFAGQAVAAARGLGGIQQLNNEINDLFSTLGKDIAPAVGVFVEELKSMADQAQKSGGFFEGMKIVLIETLKFLDDVGRNVHDFVAYWSGVVGTIAGAAGLIAAGQFKAAKIAITDGFADLKKEEDARIAARNASQKAYDDAENASIAKHEADKTAMTLKAAQNRGKVVQAEEDKIAVKDLTKENLDLEERLALIGASQEQEVQAEIQHLNKLIALEQNFHNKRSLLEQKAALLKKAAYIKSETDFLNTASGLASAQNQTFAAIGKAAGITQIAIKTPPAVANAYEFGTAFGGPVLGAVFGGIAAAAMAEQAAQIAGLALAEGGIVTGGIPGRDSVPAMLMPGELVVPKSNYEEVVNSVAAQRASGGGGSGGGGSSHEIIIGFKDNAMEIIEAQQVRRSKLGISVRGA